MKLISIDSTGLKNLGISEVQIQNLIAENPTILGLGDLVLRDKERRQANAGRLDLLLEDPDTKKRFEVEIQLGKTDESHIIRTIEYWDIERKRYPQYKHTAVIVAEEINARFFNVIQLFNGNIPLIALKMSAYQMHDQNIITFTKVLDEIELGLIDEDEEKVEVTDLEYWKQRGTPATIQLLNEIFTLVREIEPTATPKYNKYYIGTALNGGIVRNFVYFRVRKSFVLVELKLEKTEEIDIKINSLFDMSYDGTYRIQVTSDFSEEQKALLKELIYLAKEQYNR
ncbi:hypothetical protein [Neisseria zoodegmatis]|uniref:DUF5655 domain-containing protein n=1 Tax=Neisseria zoodegmatis TaxID=326523 RepID=A0AB38DSN6_9NEIS|nr:hypothetical protein [Neisseria zoodegmatis]OSI10855.1 hypothetical protein BWD10_02775 [Neisseria zoodegmatis]SNU80086.1 Uncharacterised protein [Neisseria zoodegmatis]